MAIKLKIDRNCDVLKKLDELGESALKSAKIMDLVVNGATLMSVNKDTLRGIIRVIITGAAAEVERLTAENASGREANESCRQYIETLKKELHASVETANMWTGAYEKQCEENATLKKALKMMYADNKEYNPDGMGNPAWYIEQAEQGPNEVTHSASEAPK